MPRLRIRDYSNSVAFDGSVSFSYLAKATPTGINTGTGSRYIMGWVYLTTNALGAVTTWKVNGMQSPAFSLGQLSNVFYWGLDSVNGGNNLTMTAAEFGANFPLNKWIHVAFAFTTTTANLFVNGVLLKSTAWGVAINTGTYNNLFLGKTQTAAQVDLYQFNGGMKDMIFGNGALTAQEALDNCYLGTVPSTAVSRFLMSEGSGTTVTDSIGSNSMTATNIVWSTNLPVDLRSQTTTRRVARNADFSIKGTNSGTSGVTVPNNAALNPTAAVTLACWFRLDKENTYYSLFDNSEGGITNSYFLDYHSTLGFRWYSVIGGFSRTITSTTTRIPVGNWNFITATYTGSAIYIYLNGVKLTEEVTGISGALGTNPNQLCLFRTNAAGASGALTGQAYRPMIFNVGCTLAEHQDMYYKGVLSTALTAGRVLDLQMTEGSGTTLADSSPTGAVGTMGAAMTWDRVNSPFKSRAVVPSWNDSLTFDGTNDAGTSGTTMTMGSTNKLTICARIRLNAATPGDTALFEGSTNMNLNNTFLIQTTSAVARAVDFYVHGNTGNVYAGARTPALTQNVWYTLVWTWDGSLTTNEATVYVNGIETNVTRPLNQNVTDTMADVTLYMGARAGTSLFASFNVKDVTVYAGKVFTQKEIEDYTFSDKYPTLISGETRVVQYLVNEGTGATLAATGNAAMDMTLTGTPAWSTSVPTNLQRTQIT